MKPQFPPRWLRLYRVFLNILIVVPSLLTSFPSPLSMGQTRQLQQTEALKVWPNKEKRWALIIGVDEYLDPQISPLKGAGNDARLLARALVTNAGFPQDQVIVLASDQPLERHPTRLNILRRLSNLASLVPKDGLLLVSFAGHGIERNSQAYLVPSDAQLSDDVSFLEESALSVSRIKERIRATGVGQVIILLDACRNDPGGRADAPNPLSAAYVRAFNFDIRNHEVQAFAVLYATAVGKRAYEYTEKRQGYFTWALVKGLQGAASNEKGEITLGRLLSYVQETVPKQIALDLGQGKEQRPFAIVEGYRADELVIGVSVPQKDDAIEPPAPVLFNPAAIELSFWESVRNSSDPDDFESYLQKYPNGQFVDLARRRIQTIKKETPQALQNVVTFFPIRVTVHADDRLNGWTNTRLIVRKGQRLRITATGRVFLGGGRFSTPDGMASADDDKLMRNEATGSLIAVIGDDNDDFLLIGARRDFVAHRDGVLFLGVNEGKLKDNTGTYDVVIEAEAGGSPR